MVILEDKKGILFDRKDFMGYSTKNRGFYAISDLEGRIADSLDLGSGILSIWDLGLRILD